MRQRVGRGGQRVARDDESHSNTPQGTDSSECALSDVHPVDLRHAAPAPTKPSVQQVAVQPAASCDRAAEQRVGKATDCTEPTGWSAISARAGCNPPHPRRTGSDGGAPSCTCAPPPCDRPHRAHPAASNPLHRTSPLSARARLELSPRTRGSARRREGAARRVLGPPRGSPRTP